LNRDSCPLTKSHSYRIFFGGPDKPPGALRNLLAERIELVPPGGAILWATYYFRDEGLADALIRARRRGVDVTLCVEASPRVPFANHLLRERLQATGALGENLHPIRHRILGHLHDKLFIFSHPAPVALAGSFNPSGGATSRNDEITAEIGDQDRGHNYLVEIDDGDLVEALKTHLVSLAAGSHGLLERFARSANVVPKSGDTRVFYFPRLDTGIVVRSLRERRYANIRIAASHFRDRSIARALAEAARGGAHVEIIAHHTKRRVPPYIEQSVKSANIDFHRYAHPDQLPMHSKFILLAAPGFRRVLVGSMNLTLTSRWLNHEILLEVDQPDFYDAFNRRWEQMLEEITRFRAAIGEPKLVTA
jgi:phosphatidylserine/phosphatidylglycerophosphate/cardiolipin synthase-like enzyme